MRPFARWEWRGKALQVELRVHILIELQRLRLLLPLLLLLFDGRLNPFAGHVLHGGGGGGSGGGCCCFMECSRARFRALFHGASTVHQRRQQQRGRQRNAGLGRGVGSRRVDGGVQRTVDGEERSGGEGR